MRHVKLYQISAIQTVQDNFSLRANSPLYQPCCLYGTSSVFQLYMWARRYSPTANNPGARLQKNNPVLSELQIPDFTPARFNVILISAVIADLFLNVLLWERKVKNQPIRARQSDIITLLPFMRPPVRCHGRIIPLCIYPVWFF